MSRSSRRVQVDHCRCYYWLSIYVSSPDGVNALRVSRVTRIGSLLRGRKINRDFRLKERVNQASRYTVHAFDKLRSRKVCGVEEYDIVIKAVLNASDNAIFAPLHFARCIISYRVFFPLSSIFVNSWRSFARSVTNFFRRWWFVRDWLFNFRDRKTDVFPSRASARLIKGGPIPRIDRVRADSFVWHFTGHCSPWIEGVMVHRK